MARWTSTTLAGLLGAAMASTAPAAERAGVAAAVQGDVTLTGKPRPDPVAAASGMDVLRFDRILTEREARMQILLENKTTFSVGPASEVVIDEYVYEPDKGVVEITADFVEGVFRYVSGTAAKPADRNVEIETDAGTVGVRGTSMFVTSRGGDGGGGDGNVFVGLLGPGTGNNAGMNDGGVVVSNAQGTTTVSREGFGVSVSEGQAPSAPQEIPDTLVSEVQSSISGGASGGGETTPQQDQGGGTEAGGADAGGGDGAQDAAQQGGGTQQTTGDGSAAASPASGTGDALNNPEQTAGQTVAEAAQATTPEADVTPRSNQPTESENNETPTGDDDTTRADLDPETDTVADLDSVEIIQNSDGSLSAELDDELITAGEDLIDQTVQDAELADVAFTTLGWTGVDNLDLHVTGPDDTGAIRDVWDGNPDALSGVDVLAGNGSFEAASLVDLNGGSHHIVAHNPADFQADGAVDTPFLSGDDAGAVVTLIPMGAIERGDDGTADIDPAKILTLARDSGGQNADTWIAGVIDGETGEGSVIDQLEQVGASEDVVELFK